MSLINEALKRARQESRRREALAKGLPLATPARSGPHRSWLIAAVVALALALLVSLFTIARLASNEPNAAVTAERWAPIDEPPGDGKSGRSTPPLTSADPTGAGAPAVSLHEDRPETPTEADEVVPPDPLSAGGASELMQNPESIDDSTTADLSPAGSVPRSEAPSRAKPDLTAPPARGVGLAPDPMTPASNDPSAGSSSQPRIFVGTAILASGDTLDLAGIAWSETGPYALLDERVVGLGETVMGYMVTRIAPQEVELEGSDGAILIRLK